MYPGSPAGKKKRVSPFFNSTTSKDISQIMTQIIGLFPGRGCQPHDFPRRKIQGFFQQKPSSQQLEFPGLPRKRRETRASDEPW